MEPWGARLVNEALERGVAGHVAESGLLGARARRRRRVGELANGARPHHDVVEARREQRRNGRVLRHCKRGA